MLGDNREHAGDACCARRGADKARRGLGWNANWYSIGRTIWLDPAGQDYPVDPLPGMFKSVGDMPPQPGAKVRVFFLGMQW